MDSHTFTLILDGVDVTDDSVLNALYEAGFDNATFGLTAGVPYASLSRETSPFPEAVLNAIRALEAAISGANVVRVEPDEFVNAADIAGRLHRSRESVRLLAEGRRGPGGFPPPAFLLHGSQPVWHWSEVAAWFQRHKNLRGEEVEHADFLAALNGALEVRRHMSRLAAPEERSAVAQLVAG